MPLAASHAAETVPIGPIGACYALVSVPVLARLTSTAINSRVPGSSSSASNAVKSVPVLTSGTGAGVDGRRPELSGGTSNAAVRVPEGVAGALALVIAPNLSIKARDAAEPVPVGSRRADAGVAVCVKHLSCAAGGNEGTGSSKQDIAWTTSASIEVAVPN